MPQDLVFSSCGSLVSGTPDGGFRDQQGLLRLVQVLGILRTLSVQSLIHCHYEYYGISTRATCYTWEMASLKKNQPFVLDWMLFDETIPHGVVLSTRLRWVPPMQWFIILFLLSNRHKRGWPINDWDASWDASWLLLVKIRPISHIFFGRLTDFLSLGWILTRIKTPFSDTQKPKYHILLVIHL